MEVNNATAPNSEQMAEFRVPDDGIAVHMVNLLKFKPQAEYYDGRQTDLTGKQAYDLYSAEVSKLIQKFGGSISFSGQVRRLALGDVTELWDTVAIAVYPSRAAMLKMMQSEEMKKIGIHRHAGLAGQLNIETIADDE